MLPNSASDRHRPSTPIGLVAVRYPVSVCCFADSFRLEATGVAGLCAVVMWRKSQLGRGLETTSCRFQECCSAVHQVTHPDPGSHPVICTACFCRSFIAYFWMEVKGQKFQGDCFKLGRILVRPSEWSPGQYAKKLCEILCAIIDSIGFRPSGVGIATVHHRQPAVRQQIPFIIACFGIIPVG